MTGESEESYHSNRNCVNLHYLGLDNKRDELAVVVCSAYLFDGRIYVSDWTCLKVKHLLIKRYRLIANESYVRGFYLWELIDSVRWKGLSGFTRG